MKHIFAHKEYMGEIISGEADQLPEIVDDPISDKEKLN